WQVNPAKPGDPVVVSAAGKYRKEYHQPPKLVEALVRHANLEQALKEITKLPVRRPDMRLVLDELGPNPKVDAAGYRLLRTRPATLRAVVTGVELNQLKKVEWAVGSGSRQRFDDLDDREYTADLTERKWKRGTYGFRLVVTTSDDKEHHGPALPV